MIRAMFRWHRKSLVILVIAFGCFLLPSQLLAASSVGRAGNRCLALLLTPRGTALAKRLTTAQSEKQQELERIKKLSAPTQISVLLQLLKRGNQLLWKTQPVSPTETGIEFVVPIFESVQSSLSLDDLAFAQTINYLIRASRPEWRPGMTFSGDAREWAARDHVQPKEVRLLAISQIRKLFLDYKNATFDVSSLDKGAVWVFVSWITPALLESLNGSAQKYPDIPEIQMQIIETLKVLVHIPDKPLQEALDRSAYQLPRNRRMSYRAWIKAQLLKASNTSSFSSEVRAAALGAFMELAG